MNVDIQPKLSRKTRVVIIYAPTQDELTRMEEAVRKALQAI